MTHHHARLIVVAVAAVSFSTPVTAQQEPTSPTTLETLVETLGGGSCCRVSQNEQGEVVEVRLSRTAVTDAGGVHLTGLAALETLYLWGTQVTAAGLVHFQKMPALRQLALSGSRYLSTPTPFPLFTDADIANLQEALPNVRIEDGAPVAPPPPPPPQ